MKKITSVLILSLVFGYIAPVYGAQTYQSVTQDSGGELWKGPLRESEFDFSPMLGLGMIDDDYGFSVGAAAAKKIIHQGFVPDINNQVFLEIFGGAAFLRDTAFIYSIHLRWDFGYDSLWKFFAVGGFGGASTGDSNGDSFRIHPRFALGTLYTLNSEISIRFEVSHEWTMLGASFQL